MNFVNIREVGSCQNMKFACYAKAWEGVVGAGDLHENDGVEM